MEESHASCGCFKAEALGHRVTQFIRSVAHRTPPRPAFQHQSSTPGDVDPPFLAAETSERPLRVTFQMWWRGGLCVCLDFISQGAEPGRAFPLRVISPHLLKQPWSWFLFGVLGILLWLSTAHSMFHTWANVSVFCFIDVEIAWLSHLPEVQ